MSPDAMNALFKPTIDQIVQHLSTYLQAILLSSRAETEALLSCFKPVTGIEVKQHSLQLYSPNVGKGVSSEFILLSKVVREVIEVGGVTLTHVPASL